LGPSSLLRSALSDIDGIDEAFIYGSWADPSQPNPADIDLLVIGEPEVAAVYDAVSEIEAEVGRPINVTVRSPAEWEDADGAFERAVRTGPQVDLR
ncbi:MAG: nucleotidyltransferase domain-containing protein, partial [Actinomycetota bacterium]